MLAKSVPSNDELKYPARLHARHGQAVLARGRLPVDPVRFGRRGGRVLVRARRPRISEAPGSSCSAGPLRPADDRNGRALPVGQGAARGRGRARRPARLGGRARRADRCCRRDVLEPDVRPDAARVARREEGAGRATVPPGAARQPDARPRRGASSTRPARRSRPSPRRLRSPTTSTSTSSSPSSPSSRSRSRPPR